MQSKQAKTPPLSNETKILCFDLETNGLHGEAFAVGAVVMDASGKIHDQFTGRTEIVGPIDEWVEKNVLPSIKDMEVDHKDYRDLREDFWQWFLKAEAEADYVLVSNGYPVEYRFLLKCQEENLEERYWQHPFPVLDLFSLMIQVGDIASTKAKLRSEMADEDMLPHNPLHDAITTARAAFMSFKMSGRIR